MFANAARRLPAETCPLVNRLQIRLSTALLTGWIAGHLSLWWWADLPASGGLLFGALIVVIDNRVVYKQWSGRPRIEETELRRNPLGPLQGIGESLKPLP